MCQCVAGTVLHLSTMQQPPVQSASSNAFALSARAPNSSSCGGSSSVPPSPCPQASWCGHQAGRAPGCSAACPRGRLHCMRDGANKAPAKCQPRLRPQPGCRPCLVCSEALPAPATKRRGGVTPHAPGPALPAEPPANLAPMCPPPARNLPSPCLELPCPNPPPSHTSVRSC